MLAPSPRRRNRRPTLAALLLIGFLPTTAAAQTFLDQLPLTNQVDATKSIATIAKVGSTVYVGGAFEYLGPPSGSIGLIDPTTGNLIAGFPVIVPVPPHSGLNVVVPDGAGGWYVGGDQLSIGGVTRQGIAHIRADFTLDDTWVPTAGPVTAIAVSGSTVFIGGTFNQVNGQARLGVAALDATTGALLPFNATPVAQSFSSVYALAVSGSVLYVGGVFNGIGGQPRKNLAALDASTGTAMTWVTDADNAVMSLLIDGSHLFVGGYFLALAGGPCSKIGAINAATGTVDLTWNANTAGFYVDALAVQSGVLYFGGSFASVVGQARSNIAAVSTATGAIQSWNPGADNVVSALSIVGATVYAGGYFLNVGGVPRQRLAAINATTGAVTSWAAGADYAITTIVATGTGVLAAGPGVNSVGGRTRHNLAAFDAATGALTSWDPNPNGAVAVLAIDGSTIYAGGSFTTIGGQTRNYLAALSATTGLATSWNPNPNGPIRDLAVGATLVYAAGDFGMVGSTGRFYLAAINKSNGLVTSWNPSANSPVNKVLPYAGVVFVGGEFTSVGGQPRNYAAALDPTSGNATAWSAFTNGYVRGMSANGSTLYLVGGFTVLGGSFRNYIGAVDVGSGLATPFDPHASTDNLDEVLATSSRVYTTGNEGSGIGGASRAFLSELYLPFGAATQWTPSLSGSTPSALLLDGNTLYVGCNCGVWDSRSVLHLNLAGYSIPTVGVEDEPPGQALSVSLAPNPTRGATRIHLALPQAGLVRIGLFDLNGREVAAPIERWLSAGSHDLESPNGWEPRMRGSGVYFLRVEAAGSQVVKRLVVLL